VRQDGTGIYKCEDVPVLSAESIITSFGFAVRTHLVWRCYLTYMTHHRVCLCGFAKCLSWCLPGSAIHTSRVRREHSTCLYSLPKPLYCRHGKKCGGE